MLTALFVQRSFNSRPHKEVDSGQYRTECKRIYLSTHDLTRRSTIRSDIHSRGRSSFNSRPHKEVDTLDIHSSTGEGLSTHDITRRSTVVACHNFTERILSTHDLTRRSTLPDFIHYEVQKLSTHDLTRRSTSAGGSQRASRVSFNSRPHKEVDN